MENIYSSKQVAEILGVNESSVKRWADSGMLGCFKTPGGHRKFKKNDIASFSQKYSYELTNTTLSQQTTISPQDVSFDYKRINEVLLKKLFTGSYDEILDYLYSLYQSGIDITPLYDNVIGKVMYNVGLMWKKKEITIELEHIATNKLTKALIYLHSKVNLKSRNGLIAFCGCLEKEFHELPVLSVNNVLEYNGWNTIYAGVNLPVKSFVSGIDKYKPDLVCLSVTIIEDKSKFVRDAKKIFYAATTSGAKFLIGGSASHSISGNEECCDSIIQSMSDLINYIKYKFTV